MRGCRVAAGFPFLAVVAFSLLADRTGLAGVGLVAALLHEGGHLLAMCLLGMPPRRIRMRAFGVEMEQGAMRRSYRQDAAVSLAGPAANLFCFLLCRGIFAAAGGAYWRALSDSNALLGALQSLPIGPLDGGQALATLLCSKLGPRRAERVSAALSVLTLFPLAALGFWALLRSQYNFTLLAAAGALAFFLFRGERPRGASPV